MGKEAEDKKLKYEANRANFKLWSWLSIQTYGNFIKH